MVLDALREKSMGVSVGGCMKQNMASRRERKRAKLRSESGLRECKAGYETSHCGELRVRWRELCALGEGGQNMSVLRRVLQKELGRYKTEKEREIEGWARMKGV